MPGDVADDSFTCRGSRRIFTLIVLLSLVVRLVVLWRIAGVPLVSDSTDYRGMALLLLGGKPFVPYWPPGLSLYLAPLLAAGFGDVVLRASMLVWWVLLCWGFVRLADDLKLKVKTTAILLTIFSITPALIHFSLEPMTQMPSAALLTLGISAAVRCARRESSWWDVVLLGGSLGWLSLVRPSAIPLLLALPAQAMAQRRQVLPPLMAIALGCVMLVVWMVRVHQLAGQWTLNNSNGVNLYYGNNPWTPLYRTWYFGSHAKFGTEDIHQFPGFEKVESSILAMPKVDRSKAYQHLAVDYVLHRPGLFLLRTVNRIRCFWGFDVFTAANLRGAGGAGARWFLPVFLLDAVCYLAIAGFAFFWIAAAPSSLWLQWETWLLGGSVLLYALPYWLSMSHPTYHFPVVVPLALLGAMAQRLSRSSGQEVRWRGWASLAVLALIQVEWIYFLVKP